MSRSSLPLLLASVLVSAALRADPLPVVQGPGASVRIGPDCTLSPKAYGGGWTMPSIRNEPDGSAVIDFGEGAGTVRAACVCEPAPDGAVHVRYDFHSDAETAIELLFVNVELPAGRLAGVGTWSLGDTSGTYPATYGEHNIAGATTPVFAIQWPRRSLRFGFDAPTYATVLDIRTWSDDFCSRLCADVPSRALARGATYSVAFTLTAPGGLVAVKDGPVTIAEGPEWIPLPSAKDIAPGSALDFSALYPWHAPAGARGRVIANGPHFAFESAPDAPVRFYGANLCFSANFLTPDEAEILATRFRRIGYNTVRIHHYDNFITDGSPDHTALNPEHIALLDNTLAAFIRHGVYITTDLFVSRPIPWRQVGIDRDGLCPGDEFKVRCAVSDAAFANWKDFARNFLTHVNPHTGRSYAEEPALAFLCLVNEGNLGNYLDREREIPEFAERWKAWLAARRAEAPDVYGAIPETIPDQLWNPSPHGVAYLQFVDELEGAMVERMKTFLRDELHCRALLSDSNGWIARTTSVRFRARTLDYCDDHFYFDHPRFLERPWCLPTYASSADPLFDGGRGVPACAYSRVFGRPFAISEYNYAVPSSHRAIGGMAFGTIAALQDWGVLWRFAYSHSHEALFEDRHLEYFDISLDAGMLASDRIALCLFLRGDRAPLPRSIAIEVPAAATPAEVNGPAWADMPKWASAAWNAQVGYSVAGDASSRPSTPETRVLSAEEAHGHVDGVPWPGLETMPLGTPDSRCMVFPEDDNVAAAASLDGAPVRSSRHLLVVHIPEIQDAGATFADHARTTLTAVGTLPHLVHASRRALTLPVASPAGLKVYPLNPDGTRRDAIPAAATPDGLVLDLDSARATLHYEIAED